MLNDVGSLQVKELLKNKCKGLKYKERKKKERTRNEIRTKSAKTPKSEPSTPCKKSTPHNRHKFGAQSQQHLIAFNIFPNVRRTSKKCSPHKICAPCNRHKFAALSPLLSL